MKKIYTFGLFSLGLFLLSATGFSQSVFINEIHYDNSSTDENEGIEIAAPAGTDLSGWSLVLYNGSNSEVYGTTNLTGTIADLQNGFGVAFFPITGLQNGSPDGMALTDPSNTVIQFLSYEGSITAIGGPADGMMSTDIGVTETSSTLLGNSLQLAGTGTDYSDFAWQAEASNTYGAINTGQTFNGGPSTPVINEFVFNHTGTDTDEFVEVLASPSTDYSGYWLIEIEGDGTGAGTVDEVIQIGSTDASGYWTTGFLNNALENGTVSLLLVSNFTGALSNDIDTDNDGVIDVVLWDSVIDAIGVTDGGTGDINYSGVVLTPDFDGSSFTVGGASRIPNGQDTDATSDWVRNDYDGMGLPSFPTAIADAGEAINTPGAENQQQAAPPATIMINEIDSDTPGTDIAEFIELYDGGVGNTSLDGLVLVLYNGSNNLSYNAFDLAGYTTDANGYFVLGNTGVPNVSIVFSSNGLQNGADAVALYQGSGSDFPNGTAVTTTGLVDAIVYDTNDSDDPELLPLLNAGQPQVNEGDQGDKDNHSLQRYPNGSGDLRSTDTYVAAIPTPGTSNTNITEPVTVIINEVDSDTPGTDAAEFIELYDGGTGNTALDGLVVVLYNGSNDLSYNAFDLDGYATDANGYFVLGNSGVANVSLTFSGNGLQNGADAIALYQGNAADFPSGTTVTTTNLLDAIVYDTNDADDTGLLALLNAGELQVNEDAGGDKDNESLQRLPNGTGGARNTSTYATATPTPGAENGGIVIPTEPITIAEARAATLGTTVTISGTLTVSFQLGGPAYIQDATGGIGVFDASVHGAGAYQIGDSLKITGVREAFSDQVQIGSVSSVEYLGVASSPIEPTVVTLAELGNYPGQLVSVLSTTFPAPGDLLFGNSNYTLTDGSGSGALRIDNDVTGIVGFAQPVTCNAITGVVGRYYSTFQLLPRQASDLPCAEAYQQSGDDLTIPKDSTFDIAAWNIEWFGDEGNSPAAGSPDSDAIQKDSVKAVLLAMDADVIAVEEVTDTTLFSQMVSEMVGYDFFLSDYTSYPDGTGSKQRVGFIYKTATVVPDFAASKALLASIHPYYNGGDASALVNYPAAPDRFYASGRLPYMLVADVTIQGVTKRLNLIALHARANSSSDPQLRYDMRKYDVEVLKDSLDTYYSDANVILLGDYNDDLDFTVANIPSTTSSYENYMLDTAAYKPVTLSLSESGLRSYVFSENVIDHIVTSDELQDAFIPGSARVGYEFYDSDYSSTASDHLPVSARFLFEEEVTYNQFQAVEVVSFNQGKRKNGRPIHRFRSNPEKALGLPLENYYYNFVSLGFGGDITLKLDNVMYDLPGDEFKVFESTFGPWHFPCYWYPEKAEVFASMDGVNFTSLGTTCRNGKFDLASGGLKKAQYIMVKDVSNRSDFFGNADGYDLDGIYNLIPPPAANARTSGTTEPLEYHENYVPNEEISFDVATYPNPFTSELTLNFSVEDDASATIKVVDLMGKSMYTEPIELHYGVQEVKLNLDKLPSGIYFLNVRSEELEVDQTIKVVKK